MGVEKLFVNVKRELDFYEFKRILENIKTLWRTLEYAEEVGINLEGRQFKDGASDMLLMLSTLLKDDNNLLPYFCWSKDFGELDDELTVETLWNKLVGDLDE